MQRVLLIFCLLALTNEVGATDHPEPTYRGKTLTQWTHALDEPNAEIRARAADAIAQMGIAARSATPPLARLLNDSDERVRVAAVVALEAMGPAARPAVPALTVALLDVNMDLRRRAAIALGQIGPEARPAIPTLAKLVGLSDASVAPAAATALAQIGPDAVPALVRLLHSPAALARELAARSLGDVPGGASAGSSSLLELLEKDPEGSVRAAAAETLGTITPASAQTVAALTAALRDPDQRVRLASAQALGRIGPPAAPALAALRVMLHDPAVSLRLAAAADLWSIASQRDDAIPVLVDATYDSDATIRLAAVKELGRIQAHTPAALASLVAGIKDHEARVSVAALTSLGEIGPPARATASASLRQLLTNPHPEYRLLAARALWHVDFHPNELLPVLLGALQDRNDTVRDAAANLLGEIGRPVFPAAGALHERLKDLSGYVRVDAALALWRIEGNLDDVLPPVLRIIQDREGTDPYLRQFALNALGQIGSPARDAISVIMEASEDELPSVRAAAANALRKIKGAERK